MKHEIEKLRSRPGVGRTFFVLGLALIMLAGSLRMPVFADVASPTELLVGADAAFAERFIMERMKAAISRYESVLPYLDTLSVQSQSFVIDRLSQCYYELTTFSEGNTPEDRDLFEEGKAYGLRSLRLNSDFAEWEKTDFAKATGFVTDPAALLWTANNWGALFGYNPLQGMVDVGKVKALYERGIEIDETYWGGSFHNALGAMLITLPALLGGDPEQGRAHLERAIALAPNYLENHVVYAQYWGFTYNLFGKISGIRDRKLIEHELNFVLSSPIGNWPFWNREAKKEAKALLQKPEEVSGT